MQPHVLERHPLPIGGILAVLSLPVHYLLPATASHLLAAALLVLIAGVYLGFAVTDGRMSRMMLEGAVALGFVAFSVAGAYAAPLLLPAGYLAHAVWDWAHHAHALDTRFPRWYIPACAVYDAIAGLGLWLIWLTR